MIELNEDNWYEFVSSFTGRLNVNYNVEECLRMFLDDYWAILDGLAYEACKQEEVKESTEEYATKTYLREKNQIIWDYVYNLNREINNLKKEVVLLKASDAARTTTYGPVKYPNNIPPTHEYPIDWYKVTAHSNAQDNQPLKGLTPEGYATSGYMQVVDQKYTPEQIEEWSNIRYTPEGR